MKIDNELLNMQVGGTTKGPDKSGQTGTGDAAFSNILKEASKDGTPDVASTPGINGPAAVGATGIFTTPTLSVNQQDAIDMGEEALALLEHCGCMLEQNGFSQGDLGALADALGDSANGVVEARESLDTGDPLRSALDEIAVMSVVASIKIDRGDFSG